MGKDGELWDDSALVKAFDDAISKYKVMHDKGASDDLSTEGKVTNSIDEQLSTMTNDLIRHMEADDDDIAALDNTTVASETSNPSLTRDNHSDSFVDKQYADRVVVNDSPKDLHNQVAAKMSSNSNDAEDYNHLLDQYNVLEEQRQKILEQLYQLGYWNYQGYGSTVQEGVSYASQAYEVPSAQASYPDVACCCRSYICPYSTAPCSTLAGASSTAACVGKTCNTSSTVIDNGSSVSPEDHDVIKAAMGAAERAICSFKSRPSSTSKLNTEKKKDKEIETDGQDVAEDRKSGTDLTDVLNAWFSAGFYTAKYLAEQSSLKK